MSQKVELTIDEDSFGNTKYMSHQLTSSFIPAVGFYEATGEHSVDIGNATFDVTGGAAEDLWSLTAHGLVTGQIIQFDAVGTGAEGFSVDTDYYVIRVAANTFQLATSHANAVAGTQIEGTGSDSSGTWSVTVQPQYIGYTATAPTAITRLIVMYEDSTGMQAVEYGNLGGALTNGIAIDVADASDTQINNLTDQHPVTHNANWATHCYDAQLLDWSSGNQMIAVRWTFSAGGGKPLLLATGEKFRVYLQDDLSGLVEHTYTIQGYELY